MIDQELVIWCLILAVALPLLSVVLGEATRQLAKHHNPLLPFIRNIRTLVLPSVAVLWICREVLHMSADTALVKVAATITGLTVIYAGISLVNGLLTSGKQERAWQIHVPNLLYQVARILVVLSVMAYVLGSVWKIDLSQVIAALGVGSLVFALALQDTLSNLVSGFLLIIEAPFQVGDWISIKGIEGEVVEINWRAVRIKTRDLDVVIIPNGVLGKETIENYTLLNPAYANYVWVTFSLDDAPNQVHQMLREATRATQGIMAELPPDIRTKEFTDLGIVYEIKYFILDYAARDPIRNQFMTSVYYAARRHKLTMPLPTRVMHQRWAAPVPQPDISGQIMTYLQQHPILQTLSDERLKSLAAAGETVKFGQGERILQEGNSGQSLHVLMRGRVQLTVMDNARQEQEISRLKAGDIFGEMVVWPSLPNIVSAIALTEVSTVIFGYETVSRLIRDEGAFAQYLSQCLEKRRRAVQLVRQPNTQIENSHRAEDAPLVNRLTNILRENGEDI